VLCVVVQVIHHTSAHGQRYDVDPTHENLLDGLVHKGRDRIYAYMRDKGVDQSEMARFNGFRFDSFPLEDIAVAVVARKKMKHVLSPARPLPSASAYTYSPSMNSTRRKLQARVTLATLDRIRTHRLHSHIQHNSVSL
jgi:hypothetical protein